MGEAKKMKAHYSVRSLRALAPILPLGGQAYRL